MYGMTVTFRIYAYSNLANCKFALVQLPPMMLARMLGIKETGEYCISDSMEDQRLAEKSVSDSTQDQ